MADRRETARERAREALEQTAAAAALQTGASAASAVADEEEEPPAEESTGESTVPAPLEYPVPDPPPDDSSGSEATSQAEDDSSANFTLSAEDTTGATVVSVGGSKDSPPTEDGVESALDTEEPAAEEPASVQPVLVTTQDEPDPSGVDPRLPVAGVGGGGSAASAGGGLVGQLTIDPVRERIEAAAQNLRLPGQTEEPRLSPEIARQREILRETGVTPAPGGSDGDGSVRLTAANISADSPTPERDLRDQEPSNANLVLDVFPGRSTAPVDAEPAVALPGRPAGAEGRGLGRDLAPGQLKREEEAGADDARALRGDAQALATPARLDREMALPPGLRAINPGAAASEPVRAEEAIAPTGTIDGSAEAGELEADVDAWALHRTRQSLLDEPGDLSGAPSQPFDRYEDRSGRDDPADSSDD